MIKYSEFIRLDDAAHELAMQNLSEEDTLDLFDQMPFSTEPLSYEPGSEYFETIDELHAYLLRFVVPASKPWRANEIAGHEFSHAQCAIALGATSIKYSVTLGGEYGPAVLTHTESPQPLPNLAFAAIAMHPYGSHNSLVDMRNVTEWGYASRQQVTERIQRWNEIDYGFKIPEPRSEPLMYQPK